jgi:hypothetical protein
MKCLIYSNETDFKTEADIESIDDLDINWIENYLSDEIYCCLSSSTLLEKSKGFFPDTGEVECKLFEEATACLKRICGKNVFVDVIDDGGVTILTEEFDTSQVVENRAIREQGTIDAGSVIIKMVKNFLEEGLWQHGLRKSDGTILTDISEWPKPVLGEKGLVWQDALDDFLEPVIWFGLKDEDPIECWTLSRFSRNFDIQKVLDNPYEKKPHEVERWNTFWFCNFWDLDWNAIFNNDGYNYITWMFAECGMVEPYDEFVAVRNSCPIELSKNDTSKEIIRKIEQLFAPNQN